MINPNQCVLESRAQRHLPGNLYNLGFQRLDGFVGQQFKRNRKCVPGTHRPRQKIKPFGELFFDSGEALVAMSGPVYSRQGRAGKRADHGNREIRPSR